MVLQAARLDLPMLLDARRTKVIDRGELELDGRTLRVLALELGEGLVVEAHVDPATGRILRSRGQGPAGAPLEFVTAYSDFRKVGGVLFAFREVNWANGVATGETVLEEIRVGPAPAEATFSF